jgi:hypothetical protein
MKRFVAVTVGLFLVATMSPAFASAITDPDDMTSPLDITKLVYRDLSGDKGTFRVVTQDRFNCRYLRRGLSTVKLYFDGKADGDNDLIGNFVCRKVSASRHRIFLALHGTKSGNNYEPVAVKRPNKHTMRATFPVKNIPETKGAHLNVIAKVRDGQAEGCTSAHKCHDRAPDTGTWNVY